MKRILIPAVPRTVWMLGFVSLFMDLSSELVHALLPVFLVSTLGVSVLTVGVIEGVAEAATPVIKAFSGALSDLLRRRKLLILLGYGLAALTKPLFPLATSAELVLIARFLDRIGKGIRGAPRDALVADVAPPTARGTCYGLRQSMDTVGAVLGPSLGILLMYAFANDIKQVLWFAVPAAILAVLLVVFGIKDPEDRQAGYRVRAPIQRKAVKQFPAAYWWAVAIGAIFTLARFSEAFLVLRARQVGLAMMWVPLVMVVMSLVYAFSALPAGILSDRISRRSLLSVGLAVLLLSDLVLAGANSPLLVLMGAALWGLHLGFTQGILAAMVADATPPELKGTAFGLYNLASGVCLLVANVIAGELWNQYGAASTFSVGAGLSLAALMVLLWSRRRLSGSKFR